MRLDETFLLVQLFYPIVSDDAAGDRVGDLAIAEMLGPLVARLRSEQAVRYYEFMRYSVGGYHLRMKFHGSERATLERARDRFVLPAIEEFSLAHSGLLAERMALGDFAQRLAALLGSEAGDVRKGGDVHTSFARDDAALHEDEDIRRGYLALSELMCDLAVDVVGTGGLLAARKSLARLMLMDLLDATGLDAAGLHYVLSFVRQQWVRYFTIEPGQVEACARNAAAVAPRFCRFLDARNGIEGSAEALPRELRRSYIAAVGAMATLMPDLIRRDELGVINNNTALRLMSIIHLAHNRLGMNILHEITFAEIASTFHARDVDRGTVANNESWVGRNLGRYFEENNEIAY